MIFWKICIILVVITNSAAMCMTITSLIKERNLKTNWMVLLLFIGGIVCLWLALCYCKIFDFIGEVK